MGKRKIEIVKIEDKIRLDVTFCKRRKGLFKKAADLCDLSGENIAILVFSHAGNPYTFGYPSADAIFDQFLAGTSGKEVVTEEYKKNYNINNRDDHQKIASGAESDGFWWDNINMEELDSIEKIQAVKNAMMGLKQEIKKRIDVLTSISASASPSYTAEASASPSYAAEASASPYTTEATISELDGMFSVDDLLTILNEDNDELDLHQNVRTTIDELTSLSASASTTTVEDPSSPLRESDDFHQQSYVDHGEVSNFLNDDTDETLQKLPSFTDHQADPSQGFSWDDELEKLAAKIRDDGIGETWQQLSPITDHQADFLPGVSLDDELWSLYSMRDECTLHDRYISSF